MNASRDLGRTNDLPTFALGSWHTYDRMDFDEIVRMLSIAIDQGVTLFDLGVYGRYPQKFPLSNPKLGRTWTDVVFARAIQQAGVSRDRFMIAQKIWLWAYPRLSVEEQLDHALLRIGMDCSDFLMLGDMEDDLDLGVLVEEVAALIRKGKARFWGVNNWSVGELRRADDYAAAHGLPRPRIAQLKYSVARRAKADDQRWLDFFANTGVRLQASDVFESGYFAGNQTVSRGVARDPGDIRPMIQNSVPAFIAKARSVGAKPAQLAIAFCLTHPAIATVLFGATSVAQLEENLGALDVYRKHGAELRDLVSEFWFDRGRIDPEASWSERPISFAASA